jgi:hypothetical protein
MMSAIMLSDCCCTTFARYSLVRNGTDHELWYCLSVVKGCLLKMAVFDLPCNHDEAEVTHAGKTSHSHILIKSPDTDVAVLGIAHSNSC